MTYYVEKGDATCSMTDATSLGRQDVIGALGAIPDSDNYTFTSAGTYRFWADYTGDDNNDAGHLRLRLGGRGRGQELPDAVDPGQGHQGHRDKGDDTNIANGGSRRRSPTQVYDTADAAPASHLA